MCLEMLGRVLSMEGDDNGVPASDGTTVERGTATVDVDGVAQRVSLAVLDLEGTQVAPGDWVLCHTGLALRVLDETDARALKDRRNEMLAALDAQQTPDGEA